MIREIGPIITGLMVTGRTGSKVASELGSMKVTEQIEALRAFGTDPIKKLVVPRQVATVVMILPLAIMADIIAMIGGYLIAILQKKETQVGHTMPPSIRCDLSTNSDEEPKK